MIGMGCYMIAREPKKWTDAQNTCRGMGAHLIKIDNEDENQAVENELSKHVYKCLHSK